MWDEATLCTDADLTALESRMPEMAQRTLSPNGRSAYDGKRDLAKKRIAKMLRARGMDPDGLTYPTQLADAAAALELHLIYADIAVRGDSLATAKADYYMQRFSEEMDLAALDYVDPGNPDTATRAFKTVPVRRA